MPAHSACTLSNFASRFKESLAAATTPQLFSLLFPLAIGLARLTPYALLSANLALLYFGVDYYRWRE